MTSCVPIREGGNGRWTEGNFQNKKPKALREELLDFKKACRGNIYDFLEVYLPLDTTSVQLTTSW